MSQKKYIVFTLTLFLMSLHATVVNTSQAGHGALHRVTEEVHAFTLSYMHATLVKTTRSAPWSTPSGPPWYTPNCTVDTSENNFPLA